MRYKNIYLLLAALFLASMIIFSGCRTHQPTIIEKEVIKYVHSDSVRYIDSTVVIPIERFVDIVPQYDTLTLSTTLAKSQSWLDTTNHILRGNIWNLNAIQYQYIEVEKIVKNDSIIEKELPKPYPVVEEKKVIPTFAWICIIWSVLSIVLIGVLVYLKFAKPI